MNRWEHFETLAARARDETGPRIDVTARVMDQLRRRAVAPAADWPLRLFSALSAAAAATVLVLAVQSWMVAVDPLNGLFDTLTMVMQ
jgi:hypothetical protein